MGYASKIWGISRRRDLKKPSQLHSIPMEFYSPLADLKNTTHPKKIGKKAEVIASFGYV